MNVKLKVDYIPDEDRDAVLVRDISLSPREFFEPLKGNKSIYLDNGALCYTSATRRIVTEILRTGDLYKRGSFHARSRFVINLLKKWNSLLLVIEAPKVEKKATVEMKPIKVKIDLAKAEAKVLKGLRYSPPGIQVEVVRFSKANLYLVARIQALTKEELPSIYTYEKADYILPRIWQKEDALIANNDYILLQVGKTYSYGQLKKALLYIELAGRHLEAANKHMKPNRPKWATSNVISFKDGLLLKDTTFQNHNEVDLGI